MSLEHSLSRQGGLHDRYLNRKEQVEYLKKKGLLTTVGALAKRATCGGGPRYVVWNGKALSTGPWLDEWVAEGMSQPRHSTSEIVAA